MSTAAVAADEPSAEPAGKGGGKKKLLLLAIPLLLGVIGAGLWFGGILPPLLGMGKEKAAEASEKPGAPPGAAGQPADAHGGAGEAAAKSTAKAVEPTYFDIPEIIVNLNAGARRTGFLKLHAKLELAKPEDVPGVTAAMPRVLDLFQTYLREMRPDELRGAAGTYRLREELIARASLAAAPAQIVDVLFVEMLVQ
jgi:flagellar FliL protein